MQKVTFDNLAYAKKLSQNGITNADALAEALTEVLKQTTYNTYEVDTMIEDALNRFDKRTAEMREASEKEFVKHREEFLKLENRIEKTFNRYFIATVSTLGGIIVLATTVSSILLHLNNTH